MKAQIDLAGTMVGAGLPLFIMAGPCVIESRDMALATAEKLAKIAQRLGLHLIYKSSFDKANRTSGQSYRGPGIDEGLRILDDVATQTGLPLVTDIHEPGQIAAAAQVVDVLQTPAFLARQTDFIEAVAKAGKPVNIKKAQWMAPGDMAAVIAKCRAVGNNRIMACERGTMMGYGNLVVDMRSIEIMAEIECPVVFDATHSCQLPGAMGDRSGGERRFVPTLAMAAVAAGAHGVFMEIHPDPDNALCDAATQWPLDRAEALIASLIDIRSIAQARKLGT